MLKVENISVYYGDVKALSAVSLDVPEGKVVALLGPNAAGKSTTLRAISGVNKVRAGRITFEGKPIHGLAPYEIVEMGIIHVPEGRGLFSTLTVKENLELGAYTKRARPHMKESLDHVFSILPRLKDRENQLAGSLSGGEQQMCAVARGLMARPRILMIDEMSLGLAPLLVHAMFETVKRIAAEGITVLLVEQQIHQVLKMADCGYVLENGATVLTGSCAELACHDHVKKVYLGM